MSSYPWCTPVEFGQDGAAQFGNLLGNNSLKLGKRWQLVMDKRQMRRKKGRREKIKRRMVKLQ
jgi:hypothetical protein